AIRRPEWIAGAWIGLSFLMLFRLVVSWVLLDRRRARAFRTGADLSAPTWMRMRRKVRVISSPDILVPIAVGPIHPAILIPEGLLGTLDKDELDQVVMHEAAHLARWDDYALLLQRAIEALFTLHPVVRWITRQLELEREVACDDFVIEATGRARSYATCLTRMAELCG